jgi:hypothetical protein
MTKLSIELPNQTLETLREIAESELTSVTRLVQKSVYAWLDNRRTGEVAKTILQDTRLGDLRTDLSGVVQKKNSTRTEQES